MGPLWNISPEGGGVGIQLLFQEIENKTGYLLSGNSWECMFPREVLDPSDSKSTWGATITHL